MMAEDQGMTMPDVTILPYPPHARGLCLAVDVKSGGRMDRERAELWAALARVFDDASTSPRPRLSRRANRTPIAIVGLGCVFPATVLRFEDFFQPVAGHILEANHSDVRRQGGLGISANDSLLRSTDTSYVRNYGFLQDVAGFDSPRIDALSVLGAWGRQVTDDMLCATPDSAQRVRIRVPVSTGGQNRKSGPLPALDTEVVDAMLAAFAGPLGTHCSPEAPSASGTGCSVGLVERHSVLQAPHLQKGALTAEANAKALRHEQHKQTTRPDTCRRIAHLGLGVTAIPPCPRELWARERESVLDPLQTKPADTPGLYAPITCFARCCATEAIVEAHSGSDGLSALSRMPDVRQAYLVLTTGVSGRPASCVKDKTCAAGHDATAQGWRTAERAAKTLLAGDFARSARTTTESPVLPDSRAWLPADLLHRPSRRRRTTDVIGKARTAASDAETQATASADSSIQGWQATRLAMVVDGQHTLRALHSTWSNPRPERARHPALPMDLWELLIPLSHRSHGRLADAAVKGLDPAWESAASALVADGRHPSGLGASASCGESPATARSAILAEPPARSCGCTAGGVYGTACKSPDSGPHADPVSRLCRSIVRTTRDGSVATSFPHHLSPTPPSTAAGCRAPRALTRPLAACQHTNRQHQSSPDCPRRLKRVGSSHRCVNATSSTAIRRRLMI